MSRGEDHKRGVGSSLRPYPEADKQDEVGTLVHAHQTESRRQGSEAKAANDAGRADIAHKSGRCNAAVTDVSGKDREKDERDTTIRDFIRAPSFPTVSEIP